MREVLKYGIFDISSMSTKGFWLTYVKTSFFVYFGDKNAIFLQFLLSPTWHQRERQSDYPRWEACWSRNTCVGQWPDDGVWNLYWKHAWRCGINVGTPLPGCPLSLVGICGHPGTGVPTVIFYPCWLPIWLGCFRCIPKLRYNPVDFVSHGHNTGFAKYFRHMLYCKTVWMFLQTGRSPMSS